MNIILVNYSEVTSPGGVHKVIRETAKYLSKRGHNVTIIQGNPMNLPKEEAYEGVKIIRVNQRFAKYLYGLSPSIYFYIKKYFNAFNPDVVHIHGYHTLFSPEVIVAVRRVNKKIPMVFSPHYGPYGHNTKMGKYLWGVYNKIVGAKIFKMVNKIIVASNFEKSCLLSDVPDIDPQKVVIIPHGVDKICLQHSFNQRKSEQNEITLLFAGYLLKLKGVQYIISALHELVHTFGITNIRLMIVGDGPYKGTLRRLAEQLKVDEYIYWKSFLPHSALLEEMKNSDVFLLLSENENYGIVIAEALAMGTPVIVTKRTALREFLNEPGCFGVDYPPDPKEVAELILKIVNSDVKVGPFSRKIRPWEEVVRDYERVYTQLSKV